MDLFRMHAPQYESDYESIARNGMGYTSEVAGYHDILRKGYPKPSDPSTVLLELRTAQCAPVLWATGGATWISVAFVAREDFVRRLISAGIGGFETCPVEVVKVSTRGKRRPRSSGEPEDQILKGKNLLAEVRAELPILFGLRITGKVAVQPEEELSEDDPRIRQYRPAGLPTADLFYPMYQGARYGGHLFCTRRVVDIVDLEADNVAFTPFDEWARSVWPD